MIGTRARKTDLSGRKDDGRSGRERGAPSEGVMRVRETRVGIRFDFPPRPQICLHLRLRLGPCGLVVVAFRPRRHVCRSVARATFSAFVGA